MVPSPKTKLNSLQSAAQQLPTAFRIMSKTFSCHVQPLSYFLPLYLIFIALWYPWLHPKWVIGTMPSHSPAFIYILLWSQPPSQVPTAISYPSFQSFSKCHFLQEAFLDSPDKSNLSIFWPHSTLSVPLLWHHKAPSCLRVIYLYVVPPLPDYKLVEDRHSPSNREIKICPEGEKGEEVKKY